MRIEQNPQDPQLVSADRAKKTPPAASQSEPSPVSDKATLSEDKVTISSLAAQALSQPEVRQTEVDRLRQSINNGDYKPNPSDIASSILGR